MTKNYYITRNTKLLEIHESLKEIFNYQIITAFRRNKTLSSKLRRIKSKKEKNTETKRQMLSMPNKFKVILL